MDTIHIKAGKQSLVNIKSFTFEPGKINFLFGESGIGKTLLAKTVFGIPDLEALTITINDQVYTQHSFFKSQQTNIQSGFFVFQEPSTHFNPQMSIKEQLNEGNLGSLKKDFEVGKKIWNLTNFHTFFDLITQYPKPYRPSGGEKQRLLILMAIKKVMAFIEGESDSLIPLFIFDEPTGSLDYNARNMFVNLLLELYQIRPFTIIFITHDFTIMNYCMVHFTPLLDHLNFLELTRRGDGEVELNVIDQKQYMTWFDSHIKPYDRQPFTNRSVTLSVQSGFSLIDRRFEFTDQAGTLINLEIKSGEMVYLKAPSGTGKTSVAKMITGLLSSHDARFQIADIPFEGNIDKRQLYHSEIWGKIIAMVFQHADEALNPNSTIIETIRNLDTTIDYQKSLSTAKSYFPFDEYESIKHKQIRFLSGGQKQRVNLLRSFLLPVKLIILDEPFNGLDLKSVGVVLDQMQKRLQEGVALLIISHNEEIFDRITLPENRVNLRLQGQTPEQTV